MMTTVCNYTRSEPYSHHTHSLELNNITIYAYIAAPFMTSLWIAARAAIQQTALDFTARSCEEIDVVTLQEVCLNNQVLIVVVQSWIDKVASRTSLGRCGSEQCPPIVGSSLELF